ILRRWIAAGLPNDVTDAPKLTRLEVKPREQILFAPTNELQLHVLAEFSDGSKRDLSSLAVYDSANNLPTISHDGLVKMARPGETTVLVRYLDRQEPVRLAHVPERPGFRWKQPTEANYVDKFVFGKLRQLRINPSDVCSDEVFLRRVTLDLLGMLPT